MYSPVMKYIVSIITLECLMKVCSNSYMARKAAKVKLHTSKLNNLSRPQLTCIHGTYTMNRLSIKYMWMLYIIYQSHAWKDKLHDLAYLS